MPAKDKRASATCPDCGKKIVLRTDNTFKSHLTREHGYTIQQAERAAKKAGAR
jgi:uncharacterized C2H2 Zn-finger protein